MGIGHVLVTQEAMVTNYRILRRGEAGDGEAKVLLSSTTIVTSREYPASLILTVSRDLMRDKAMIISLWKTSMGGTSVCLKQSRL